ncbi:THAP9 transposase, partial [Heliornis fulica]|nr:THAP9 transposase [Heliornis fulica]
YTDLPCDLDSWRQMAQYSPEMKQFACVLHLYNTKAYDSLRKIFPLPHPYSLTKQVCINSESISGWLSTNKATAGFSNDIFLSLQEKVERGEQAYLCCSLMLQEVSLHKGQEWDPQTQHPTGFIDVGAGALDADEAPLASEAIILMAVGISNPWTAPLGYFFLNNTTGHLLAQLLRQAINKLTNSGIRVLAVTSGTTPRGAELARALGIRIDPERLQCTFHHPPGSSHAITYFFDICQALQLVRNALQCFQSMEWLGDAARWQHVAELAALRDRRVSEPPSPKWVRPGREECYHLRVNPATLLFSEGAAAALEHLQELGLASFQNCSGTVRLVRLMSRLGEVFYGRSTYGRGLEQPLAGGNHTKVNQLFNEAKSFFLALKDSTGRRVVKSKRRLGFLSFLLNAESLRWLHTNYTCAEGSLSPHLLPSSFSLDPLELFLRDLQQAWGSNRSPTCSVFQAAYHRVLAGRSLGPAPPHRSVASSNISMAWRRDLTLGSICAQYTPACGRPLEVEYPHYADLLEGSTLSDALTDPSLRSRRVARAAGFVAEQLASALQCEACVASLLEAEESRQGWGALLYVKKLGGVSLPSVSVSRVTSLSERVLNRYSRAGGGGDTTKQHLDLGMRVLEELVGESPLFPSLTSHLLDGELGIDNHYTLLVKEITQSYLNIRTRRPRHRWGRDTLKICLFPSPLGSSNSSQSHLG